MKILRVDMRNLKATYEELPEEFLFIGGRGLIAKILNKEVPPRVDPLGTGNKLIIASGLLAGTRAPQLGRVSIGAKSPLTLGIKEANAGGPAAQKLDRIGIRAIIVEGTPEPGRLYCLIVSKDGTNMVPVDEYRGLNNYRLIEELYKKYDKKTAIISIGIGGERQYKSASVALTDMFGEPSRSAGRGGMGAVMGSKGLKAIIIDDSGTKAVDIANEILFKKTVESLVKTIKEDITCGNFSEFGTPLAIAPNSYAGTVPWKNYSSGRPEGFQTITGEAIRSQNWERGGKMHACMPGCVVQCSIVYNDAQGKSVCSAYEYEAVVMLGTNLGILDLDTVARMKHMCDDLGIDLIELGSSLGVAASAGKMKFGDVPSAIKLIQEIEKGTEFGSALANGVVATAKALNIDRIPAFKGQAIPGHEPRTVKGLGVTYATSPMGADHTAGLTYRSALQKNGQAANSLRFQIQAAVCDTIGYCINALAGGQTSIYEFLADLVNARYGASLTADDIVEIGKQTLRDERQFNEGAEYSKIYGRYPDYLRTEPLSPQNSVFDVEDSEIDGLWRSLDAFKRPTTVWETRFPTLPSIRFGAGVFSQLGQQAKELNIKKALLIADPMMEGLGHIEEVRKILEKSGLALAVFAKVEPDPPMEVIDKSAQIYREENCDGLIALGGGSAMDSAKATAVKVANPMSLREYDARYGGTGRIKGPLPPVVCIPTTSGTGSEMNGTAMITDKEMKVKIPIMNNLMIPKAAIVDPLLCQTMPPAVTADTGLDVLAHCVEAYLSKGTAYHPYYEALALYGLKLVGKSLRKAYINGADIDARTDMCMAASFGGIAITKGLGLGHAIGHVLGAHYHIPHGRSCAMGLLCFVKAGKRFFEGQTDRSPFAELAWILNSSTDLELAITEFYKELNVPLRLSELGIPETGLKKIAFETTKDVGNITANPVSLNERQILGLLKEIY